MRKTNDTTARYPSRSLFKVHIVSRLKYLRSLRPGVNSMSEAPPFDRKEAPRKDSPIRQKVNEENEVVSIFLHGTNHLSETSGVSGDNMDNQRLIHPEMSHLPSHPGFERPRLRVYSKPGPPFEGLQNVCRCEAACTRTTHKMLEASTTP